MVYFLPLSHDLWFYYSISFIHDLQVPNPLLLLFQFLPFSSILWAWGILLNSYIGVSFMNMLQMSEAMRDGRSISLKSQTQLIIALSIPAILNSWS